MTILRFYLLSWGSVFRRPRQFFGQELNQFSDGLLNGLFFFLPFLIGLIGLLASGAGVMGLLLGGIATGFTVVWLAFVTLIFSFYLWIFTNPIFKVDVTLREVWRICIAISAMLAPLHLLPPLLGMMPSIGIWISITALIISLTVLAMGLYGGLHLSPGQLTLVAAGPTALVAMSVISFLSLFSAMTPGDSGPFDFAAIYSPGTPLIGKQSSVESESGELGKLADLLESLPSQATDLTGGDAVSMGSDDSLPNSGFQPGQSFRYKMDITDEGKRYRGSIYFKVVGKKDGSVKVIVRTKTNQDKGKDIFVMERGQELSALYSKVNLLQATSDNPKVLNKSLSLFLHHAMEASMAHSAVAMVKTGNAALQSVGNLAKSFANAEERAVIEKDLGKLRRLENDISVGKKKQIAGVAGQQYAFNGEGHEIKFTYASNAPIQILAMKSKNGKLNLVKFKSAEAH